MSGSDGDEPASLRGRFVSVRFAGGLPDGCYEAFAAQMSGTPMMGDWSPPSDSERVADQDGVVLERASGRVVGLICSTPSVIVPDAGVISLYFGRLAGGEAFFLEGALRYCGWLLRERYTSLHAEVLVANRRMNRMFERLSIPRSVLQRQARYFGGRWWDIGLYVISPERFANVAATWGPCSTPPGPLSGQPRAARLWRTRTRPKTGPEPLPQPVDRPRLFGDDLRFCSRGRTSVFRTRCLRAPGLPAAAPASRRVGVRPADEQVDETAPCTENESRAAGSRRARSQPSSTPSLYVRSLDTQHFPAPVRTTSRRQPSVTPSEPRPTTAAPAGGSQPSFGNFVSSCINSGGNSAAWCTCVLSGLQQQYSAAAWAALSTREAPDAIADVAGAGCMQYYE